MSLCPLHYATCVDEGVVAHVRGREVFSGKVRNPVMELVMSRRDEASLFAVHRMAYRDSGVKVVTEFG